MNPVHDLQGFIVKPLSTMNLLQPIVGDWQHLSVQVAQPEFIFFFLNKLNRFPWDDYPRTLWTWHFWHFTNTISSKKIYFSLVHKTIFLRKKGVTTTLVFLACTAGSISRKRKPKPSFPPLPTAGRRASQASITAQLNLILRGNTEDHFVNSTHCNVTIVKYAR